MNTVYQTFFQHFAIAFAVALFLPRWRHLAALAAIFLPLAIWMNLGGDGHASLALILVACASGLLSGTRARPILLGLPRKAKSAIAIALASAAAFALLPGSMAAEVTEIAHAANVTVRKWETRPPSDACFAKKYFVSIAGATYHLPAAPVITVRAGKNSYHFQFNNGIRAICDRTGGAKEPIHAENLSLDFNIPMRGPFCETTTDGWGRELCSPASKTDHGAHPAIANIYSPEEYDRGHPMAAHSYASFVQSRDRAIAAGHPFKPEPAGVFDHYANGYWVARNEAWTNEAGEPYTLNCHDSAPSGTLSCTTTYRLKTGSQVTYHFSAQARKLEPAARQIEQNFHLMMTELAAP